MPRFFVSFLCFAVLFTGHASSQWVLTKDVQNDWNGCVFVHASENGDTTVFLGYSSGISRSSDHGYTWSFSNTGLGSRIDAITSVGTTLVAGSRGLGIYISSDDGYTWVRTLNILRYSEVRCLATDGDVVYAIADTNQIFRSFDHGSTWEIHYADAPSRELLALIPAAGTLIVAGAVPSHTYILSEDRATWRIMPPIPATVALWNLAYADTVLIAAAGPPSGGVFLSRDTAKTWEGPFGGSLLWLTTTCGSVNGVLYAGGNSNLISGPGPFIISRDGGYTWDWAGDGLPVRGNIDASATTGNTMVLLATSGAYVRPLQEIFTPTSSSHPVNTHFSILPVFPNPAVSRTDLSFSLPERSDVAIEVYDRLSRRVISMPPRNYTAGSHRTSVDVSQLPSGAYYCRFTANGRSASQLVIIYR